MKNKIFATLLAMTMVFGFPLNSAFAYEAKNNDATTLGENPALIAVITITDPETKETWQWKEKIADDVVKKQTICTRSGNTDQSIAATIDIGKYLSKTKDLSQDATQYDYNGVSITTGLSYAVSGRYVSVTRAFGNIVVPSGYYASNRYAFWRNAGLEFDDAEPTSNSWSYSVDPEYAYYTTDTKPYSGADARINIYGMSSYRDITVSCFLSL